MRDSARNARTNTLQLDRAAHCSRQTITGTVWYIVRDGRGTIIGRHRTAIYAWEAAASALRARKGPAP